MKNSFGWIPRLERTENIEECLEAIDLTERNSRSRVREIIYEKRQ